VLFIAKIASALLLINAFGNKASAQETEILSSELSEERLFLSSKESFYLVNTEAERSLDPILNYDTITSEDGRFGHLGD
jgi:hypothetical protein